MGTTPVMKQTEPDLKPLFFRILPKFFIIVLSTLSFFWLIMQMILDYFLQLRVLENSGVLGIAFIIMASAFVSAILTFAYFARAVERHLKEVLSPFDSEDSRLTGTLIMAIESAYQEKKWEEVLKIGSVLSRPLWVTGKYRLRVRLGKLTEAAASFGKHPRAQASALIDDLGWTNFILGNASEARGNINHGIKLAEKYGDYYVAIKGYRHLSGIAVECGNLEEAQKHLQKGVDLIKNLESEDLRTEMLAGLYVNEAILDMKKCNWRPAIGRLEEAQKMYERIGDRDREVKLYHFKGDALYGLGNLKAAKDTYREGLSASKQESRKDGILNNTIGIADIAATENDLEEARTAYEEAADVALEIGLNEQARELKGKANSL